MLRIGGLAIACPSWKSGEPFACFFYRYRVSHWSHLLLPMPDNSSNLLRNFE